MVTSDTRHHGNVDNILIYWYEEQRSMSLNYNINTSRMDYIYLYYVKNVLTAVKTLMTIA